MDTVIFVDQSGQEMEVEPHNFDAAFSEGLKPRDQQEMGLFESFKAGLSSGVRPAAELAAGMTGWPFQAAEPSAEEQLKEAQAWEEHPIAYGAGKALPTAGAILAGAVGVRGGMKATGAVAGPHIKPIAAAAKSGWKETMSRQDIPDPMGLGKPIAAAGSAITRAAKQVPETRREIGALEQITKPQISREAGAVGPTGPQPLLGVEVLEPGYSPQKRAISERAATLAGGNLDPEVMQRVLEMGADRRIEARAFQPQKAAEEITPGLKASFEALKRGKGEAYAPLFEAAAEEYQPEMGLEIPREIKKIRGKAQKTESVTGAARSTLKAVQQIIGSGPDLYEGVTPGKWQDATPQEQYRRIKAAREYLNAQIRQMKRKDDPTILNQPSRKALSMAQKKLDTLMKSIPSQAKADELYSESMKAKEAFYDAMEFGKGEKKKIDVPTVRKLFGDNPKAYRIQEGIETMRAYLDKYGNEILPEKAAEMRKVVDRFDALRKQAEDQRLIESFRYEQGPTSPAFERTASLREKQGLQRDIFTSPASAINAADQFMRTRGREVFGQGAKFEALTPGQKRAVVLMLVWRQQHPEASASEETAMFQKILKKEKGTK